MIATTMSVDRHMINENMNFVTLFNHLGARVELSAIIMMHIIELAFSYV